MPESATFEDILALARAGESFSFEASSLALPALMEVARTAARAKTEIRFDGLDDRPVEDFMRLTVAGHGHVTFGPPQRPRSAARS